MQWARLAHLPVPNFFMAYQSTERVGSAFV